MPLLTALRTQFDQEFTSTRRLLERVPDGRGEWRPHPKSFPLGHLAQLVSWMPAWVANTITETSLDIAKAPGYTFESTATLLKGFDENAAAARSALAGASESDFDVAWSLTRSDMVLMSAPRGVMVIQHLGHLSHHRGQLTVYLRLLDVPVSSIYGPTADERM